MLRIAPVFLRSFCTKACIIMNLLPVCHVSLCSKKAAPMRRKMDAAFESKEDKALIRWINSPTNAHDGAALHILVPAFD